MDLRQRNLQGELMDDPSLNHREHARALAGLSRINRVTNSYLPLWRAIRDTPAEGRPLCILDLACGAGDTLASIGGWAKQTGKPVELHGMDLSPTAIEIASRFTGKCGLDVTYHVGNVLDDVLETKSYDVVYCSLFLHHLSHEDAVVLFKQMTRLARRTALVSDLLRSSMGYAWAYVGTRVLSRSTVVHVDGPRSVEAAFTSQEVNELIRIAGLEHTKIKRFWPERFLLSWTTGAVSTGTVTEGDLANGQVAD